MKKLLVLILFILVAIVLSTNKSYDSTDKIDIKENQKGFENVDAALDFLITCIEKDSFELFYPHIIKHETERQKRFFEKIKKLHLKKNLRNVYKGRRPQENENFFTFGGHGSQFNHLHVFYKKENELWYYSGFKQCK